MVGLPRVVVQAIARPAVFAAALAASLLASAKSPAQAIPATPVAEPNTTLTPQQREAMFAKLAKEVDEFERQQNILKTVVKLVSPNVVHIDAEVREAPNRSYQRTLQETGSGVIIELKGSFYVLTNRHVVRNAKLENIVIRFDDGRSAHPTKVWTDADTDIGVLAIEFKSLIPARIGNSDILEIGDTVVAVGSPFGLSHSVTTGIISAKGRRDLELGEGGVRFQDFIQTDAAINPGNSGGPLLNLRGELVGINTAIASSSGHFEGIGFSIPVNMAMIVARQLTEHGVVSRAYLGVRLDSKFNANDAAKIGLPRLQGARLLRIEPGSPAEAVGLQEGDVIMTFNGIRVESDTHLVNLVGLTAVGTEVPIAVFRDRKQLNMKVRVGNANPQ
ncbi:MAG: trypsin-like peptidase domain-containing protein [Planctomycetes bacterium]|nr:trypsin-like peptidase domain-containing protein [Planctomycetota bacterium]